MATKTYEVHIGCGWLRSCCHNRRVFLFVISRIRDNDRRINELVLQDRLDFFRRSLRQYAERRQELPQSLAELRSSGLAHNLEDPITGRDDWQVVIGEDPNLVKGKRGIINIHSSSTAISSRGTPYNSW